MNTPDRALIYMEIKYLLSQVSLLIWAEWQIRTLPQAYRQNLLSEYPVQPFVEKIHRFTDMKRDNDLLSRISKLEEAVFQNSNGTGNQEISAAMNPPANLVCG